MSSKTYHQVTYTDADPLAYFRRGKKNDQLIHPETAALLDRLLSMLAEKGEEETFAYIRAHLHRRPLFGKRRKSGQRGAAS